MTRRVRTTALIIGLSALLLTGAVVMANQQPPLTYSDPGWKYPWAKTIDPRRAASARTRTIMERLAVKNGMAILDIGTGAGFFAFLLAEEVGADGKVYATDTNLEMVQHVEHFASQHRVSQVIARQVAPEEVGVDEASVDRVLMVNVYRFSECQRDENQRYLRGIADALRPDGLLVVFSDFVRKRGWGKGQLKCGDAPPEALVQLAAPNLEQASLEHRPPGFAASEDPGYLLVLRKRQ